MCSVQEVSRERGEEERRQRRQEKMRAARQEAIHSLHQKREEKRREGEKVAQEEIVSGRYNYITVLIPSLSSVTV